MKKLTIKRRNNIEIIINSKKYLLGESKIKYQILRDLKLFFSREKSEYRKENHCEVEVLINEKPVDFKRTRFFYVDDQYSIEEDCKLTSKSLMGKYLEIKYSQMDYFETINTLNILLESFQEELNIDEILKVKFNHFATKQLLKICKPEVIEEFQKDEYDMDQEEIILFQLHLIEYIQNHNLDYENTIVYVRIQNTTEKIREAINHLNQCITLIDTEFYNKEILIEEIFLCEKITIDLNDDETLYYLISQRLNDIYSLKEVKTMIKKYILKTYLQQNSHLIDDIKSFSTNKSQS